jgi:hypothetical protein
MTGVCTAGLSAAKWSRFSQGYSRTSSTLMPFTAQAKRTFRLNGQSGY